MYEQVSHSLLNDILNEFRPGIRRQDLRHFYTRLGANFYAIYSLFHHLYGGRDDFRQHMIQLVEVMANRYIERSEELEKLDIEREQDHNWFLSQELVGMALYADGFAGNLNGLTEHIDYLHELGVNMVHIMPMMPCPDGASDGGYAVSDFKNIDPRIGSLKDLDEMTKVMREKGILLTLDVVVNHSSDEHQWAQNARKGDKTYQDYYYTFPNRDIPDMFEESMPEVFPETSPGNFIWDPLMERWVMSVFNSYQWDLNYSNPAVFIEMLDVILFWANRGADILRLDAVAFLAKKIGTNCQNQREAHLILQLMKDCCQVTAPGVLFIAEAIVAPFEIIKYFGEDAVIAKECEIAYNATFMALLWDAVATRNAKILHRGIESLPHKLDRATWLNYIRCHDDIGLGFDDSDIARAGYDPHSHRRFLLDYFTGKFEGSAARGMPFAVNDKTGDARISGSLASLAGLQAAIEKGDEEEIDKVIKLILTLHGMILSFGGIPLIYYGDEVGTLNDCSYLDDEYKKGDNRWMHRPRLNWDVLDQRFEKGSVQNRLYYGLKQLIEVRKSIPAFADFNNRELLPVDNEHLFVFQRNEPQRPNETVLVVANFDSRPQYLDFNNLLNRVNFRYGNPQDLATGEYPSFFNDQLVVPPYRFYWLAEYYCSIDDQPKTNH